MADWTTISVAAVTGLSGVAGGYLTMRAQIKAERWKMQDERRFAARDRRLETYREFLDVEQRLWMLTGTATELDAEKFEEWFDPFTRSYNLLAITGSDAVREIAKRFRTEVRVMQEGVRDDNSQREFSAKFKEEFGKHRTAFDELRRELLKTMRAEVEAGA